MTFKAMLVHLDDSPWSDGRVEVAVRLAQRFGCALAGVYLRPKAELTPSVAAVLPEQAVVQRLLESGQAQDRAKARFGERARPLGAAEAEFRAPAGERLFRVIWLGPIGRVFVRVSGRRVWRNTLTIRRRSR